MSRFLASHRVLARVLSAGAKDTDVSLGTPTAAGFSFRAPLGSGALEYDWAIRLLGPSIACKTGKIVKVLAASADRDLISADPHIVFQ